MGRLSGKVAFITGAARGQGRAEAVKLASEGADIIAIDICAQIGSVPYPMGTEAELAETVAAVEALDRRIVARKADTRDRASLAAALDAGVAELGGLDIVVANAGIAPMGDGDRGNPWQDSLDVNLTGPWNTVEASLPHLRARGGGAIVLISSSAGITSLGGHSAGGLGYTAAKTGVVGLMRAYANNLAAEMIRVTSVHPTGVRTPMTVNAFMAKFLEEDTSHGVTNAMPVDMVEPEDIANAVAWLVSDDARYVTGITVPVDAGYSNKS